MSASDQPDSLRSSGSSGGANKYQLKNAFKVIVSDESDTESKGSGCDIHTDSMIAQMEDISLYHNPYNTRSRSTIIRAPNMQSIRRENTIVSLTKLAKDLMDDAEVEKAVLSDIAISESSITSSNASIGGMIISRELNKNVMKDATGAVIVTQMLRIIKKLNQTKHRRLSLYEFIDMIRDIVYRDVSLVMFNEYQKSVRYYPKDHYFHYYIYFLNYGAYYHIKRYKSDIPDTKQKSFHSKHFKLINEQMNYIHSIIKQKKRDIRAIAIEQLNT